MKPEPFNIASLLILPAPLVALQSLLDRCVTAEQRKQLIEVAGRCEAIDRDDADLLMSAYQLETA